MIITHPSGSLLHADSQLESTGGEVGAPIVIGAAEPGRGRVIPLESLATDSAPQTQDIFALPEAVLNDPARALPNLSLAPQAAATEDENTPASVPETDEQTAVVTAPALEGAVPPEMRDAIIGAARRLIELRPELAEELMALYGANEIPSTSLIQETLGVIGGRMTLRLGADGLEPRYILPGYSGEITYGELVAALGDAAQSEPLVQGNAPDFENGGPDTENPPWRDPAAPEAISFALALLNGEMTVPPFLRENILASALISEPLAQAAADADAGMDSARTRPPAGMGDNAFDGTSLPGFDALSLMPSEDGSGNNLSVIADAITLAEVLRQGQVQNISLQETPALNAMWANSPAIDLEALQPEIVITELDPVPELQDPADPEMTNLQSQRAAEPLASIESNDAATLSAQVMADEQPVGNFGGYVGFTNSAPISLPMQRMMDATRGLLELPDGGDRGSLVLPPTLFGEDSILDMATLQVEALELGATLLRLPRALSALPVRAPRPDTCWSDTRIQVSGLPTLILWLDILSLNVDLDLADVDPSIQAILIEAALSPDRIRHCLEQADTPFAANIIAQSAFLTESARNKDFGQFLFRSMPGFDLELSGVKLSDDRFIQTSDSRRLFVGMAPTVNSRLTAIGDLGALFRVEGGYQVLLYPDTLSWRIALN